MSEYLSGICLAAAFLLLIRRFGEKERIRILAKALIVAALIYVGFTFRSFQMRWLLIESGGVILYLCAAWLGIRYSAWFLSAGWATHILWDAVLHGHNTTDFVPHWYPGICTGFDLLVAANIARQQIFKNLSEKTA